jgi:hypothetical protein
MKGTLATMRPNQFLLPALALPAALAMATPALAQPGGWGADPWGREPLGSERWGRESASSRHAAGPAEGHVEVSRFVAEGDVAKALGRGVIAVTGAPTGSGADSRELRTYEAAVIDQLAQLGYRTDAPADSATQIAELHIGHDVVVPQEQKRSPVSGEMAVGVSNRGTAYGLALNVDLTKPRGALIATQLELRIRDKATGAALWEGRADVLTREGDEKWSDGVVAAKLAAALFDGFPGKSGEGSGGG